MNSQFNKYIGFFCFAVVIILIGNAVYQTFKPIDDEFEVLSSQLEKWDKVTKNSQKAIENAEKFLQKADSVFESIDEEFEMISYIADQYYELSQKEEFTEEDLAMLKFYYEYLVSHGINLK